VEDQVDKEFVRWLYTAVTRATEELYLVNFSPSFFVTGLVTEGEED
jgi:exodeoxyribonuclease-5